MTDNGVKRTKTELLPCPFCGGEAELVCDCGFWWARCGECSGCGPATGKEQAIEAWNTRAQGKCKVEEYEDTGIPVCSECGAVQPDDHIVYYCWCCGRKVVS